MSDGFFERPPAQPEPEPEPSLPWTGPPSGVLPGVAALELVLASNERAAVYIGRCSVYPTGLELEVRVLVRGDDLDPSLNGAYYRPGRGSTYGACAPTTPTPSRFHQTTAERNSDQRSRSTNP